MLCRPQLSLGMQETAGSKLSSAVALKQLLLGLLGVPTGGCSPSCPHCTCEKRGASRVKRGAQFWGWSCTTMHTFQQAGISLAAEISLTLAAPGKVTSAFPGSAERRSFRCAGKQSSAPRPLCPPVPSAQPCCCPSSASTRQRDGAAGPALHSERPPSTPLAADLQVLSFHLSDFISNPSVLIIPHSAKLKGF